MSGKIIVGVLWSFLALGVSGFAYLFFLATMTGCDLRIRVNMAAFVAGTAIVMIAFIGALLFIWRHALG